MAISEERNTDLAFDTDALRRAGKRYAGVAQELRTMATELDKLLADLKENGWTTPAGKAFHRMADTSWKTNIELYASLLDTLNTILDAAAAEYGNLMLNHVRVTKVKI